MHKKYRRVLITSLLYGIFLIYTSALYAQTYGLKFKGHEVTLDRRTELDLCSEGFMKFKDEFEISFDYKTTRIKPNSNDGFFGYVFRIVNQDFNNIDLLSTPTPSIGLNVVVGKSNTIIPVHYPLSAVNNWIRLRMKFLLSEDRLVFYTPDTFYVQENVGFKKHESLKIIFGANDYKQFKNSDVPSMTIKDIKISEKGNLKFHWPLNEEEGNIAKDGLKNRKASVKNPSWLIRNHQNWRKLFEGDTNDVMTVTADPEGGRIFIIGTNDLSVYSAQKNSIRKIKYKNKIPFISRNYRAIFNNRENNIYCYLVDETPSYKLNIETGQWNKKETSLDVERTFRHHNSYYNASRNEIYLFGGYGLHRYENSIRKIDLTKKVWEDLPTNDTIFGPRYLAGLGALDDTVYILGGYGSESGNQLINPQSYFDLFGYSIKNKSLFKKFEIPRLIDDMVLGNSMWINEQNRDYYALIYSKIKFDNELQLIKGNLDSPEVELVGDKIPFRFLDIKSFASLYYMPTQNKLFVYTSYLAGETTEVAIYSIDNPPNSTSVELLISESRSLVYLYIVLGILMLLGIVFWVFVRRRKDRIISNSLKVVNELEPKTKFAEIIGEPVLEQPNYQFILFGGFQVYSKDLSDITNKFSPLLKELFLLILLHTFKNNKGISSEKITEVLWYDKSEKSARNNRAVNIAKLRGILEEVGSCELSKKTGYWKINFKECEIKSDYSDLLDITASKDNLSKQKVNQLIEITQEGAFLSNVNYEWLDDFKASVSDTILDTLVRFGQSCDIKKEAEFIIHLSDSIFNFDVISEDAMILKCKAQYCMGKHGHAKATYGKFFKEYLAMYDQEYKRSFVAILEIKE